MKKLTIEQICKLKKGQKLICIDANEGIINGGVYHFSHFSSAGNITVTEVPNKGYFPERFVLGKTRLKVG